jgi:hypothetical protein
VTQVTLICDFCHGSASSKWVTSRDAMGAALVKGGSAKTFAPLLVAFAGWRGLGGQVTWLRAQVSGECLVQCEAAGQDLVENASTRT